MQARRRPVGHATRTRVRDILPPVQIRTTGSPISVADSVTGALVFAAAFAALGWVLGFDPRRLFR